MPSYKSIKKFKTPQSSSTNAYVVNIYKNESFFVSYSYPSWSMDDVEKEVLFLKNRFPEYMKYRVELDLDHLSC